MRLIRMLGLVVLGGLAVMAFVGAAAASADTFCEENVGAENECPEGQRLAEGKLFMGLTEEFNPARLLGLNEKGELINTTECHSTVLGKVGANDGEHTSRLGLIESLTFTNCAGYCKKGKGHSAPFLFKAVALEGHVFVYKDNETGLLPGALFEECALGVSCLYESTVEATVLDIKFDLLKATQEPLKRSGHSMLCPPKAQWDADYLLTLDVNGKPGAPIYLAGLP
jgi:hypothetical protein